MGGSYSTNSSMLDLSPLIRLMTSILNEQSLLEKWPLSDAAKQMVQHKTILNKMLVSADGSKQLTCQLIEMCKENEGMSRKMAKVFIKMLNNNRTTPDVLFSVLKVLKKMLLLDDSLQRQRLEWVFGVSQLGFQKSYGTGKFSYGVELVKNI